MNILKYLKMKYIFLKDVPKQCPECDAHIFSAAPRPKMQKIWWLIALLGIIFTGVWSYILITSLEKPITPNGAISALLYGWPFYLSALVIWRLPLQVTAKCFKCKWTKTYKIETPKINN